VGASAYDQLVRIAPSWMVVQPINVAEKADDEELYYNLRAQLLFGLSEWLEGASIPESDRLDTELVLPEYTFDAQGRYKLRMSKDQEREQLGRSPDLRDALSLAVYADPPSQTPASVQAGGTRKTHDGTIASYMS
jgi:hypothetical protein